MINYLKKNVYNTRYKNIDINSIEEKDKKFFKIGKIDNNIAIQLENSEEGDLKKVIENIKEGFEHLSREFYNVQPLLKNKFKLKLNEYNENTIIVDIKTTNDLKYTLPMFMNQIIYSLISSDFINKNNVKLISKKLYEKYIGEAPKSNEHIVDTYISFMHTIINLMKEAGYSVQDCKKVYNALNEEMAVRQYFIVLDDTVKKYNIDVEKLLDIDNFENNDPKRIEDIKKYIDILSIVYDIKLETFSQKHYNIVENSKVEEKSI